MSGGVYTTNLIKSLGALTDVDSDNRLDGQAPVYNLSKDIYEHKTVLESNTTEDIITTGDITCKNITVDDDVTADLLKGNGTDLFLGQGLTIQGTQGYIIKIINTQANVDQVLISNRNNNNNTIRFNPYIGVVTCASVVQYSDIRNKTKVRPITDATETLKKLKPKMYCLHTGLNVNTATPEELKQYCVEDTGLIAQDLESECPELGFIVKTDEEGMKSINYNSIIGYLIKSIQELDAKVQELTARLDT